MNYFLGREIVGKTGLSGGRMVRDRMTVTFMSLTTLLLIASPFALALHLLPNAALTFLALAILILECMACDMNIALISMGHPLAANALLFVRSAAWVFPVAGFGIFVPEFRTLNFIFSCWLIGLMSSFAAMLWVLRAWPLRAIMSAKIDKTWAVQTIRHGWLIYLSDISCVGTMFLDRYVVNHFLGLSLTGVFTLYWSVANSVHTLVNAGILQVFFPQLVTMYNKGDYTGGRRFVWQSVFKIIGLSVSLGLIAGLCFPPLLALIGKSNIVAYAPVFWVMLAGICVRLLADAADCDLAARHLDQPWAFTNMLGVFIAFGFSVLSIKTMGFIGAGVSVIATQSVLCLMRVWVLARMKPLKGKEAISLSLDTAEEI